jgi:hypothetical protein
MEKAVASGDSRKFFRLTPVIEPKKSGVSETICEEDGTLVRELATAFELPLSISHSCASFRIRSVLCLYMLSYRSGDPKHKAPQGT